MSKKIVLLGFYVGDAYFEEHSRYDTFPQIAAYKLESRFLAALRIGGAKVKTIASLAVSTYPRNKKCFFPGGSFSDADGQGVITPIINIPVLKVLSRLFGSLINLFKVRKQGVDLVCVYAAHTPNLLAAYILRKIYGVPFFVYIPDLPSYMDMAMDRSSVMKFLKKVDGVIIDALISGSSGVFVTSRHMVEDSVAWSDKEYLVVEGISNSTPAAVEVGISTSHKKVVFYAGGLNRAYGIDHLVEGFIEAEVDAELWLCGRGELEHYISDMSKRHSSIKYLGFLSASEVEIIQSSASCLVLSRDPKERYTLYSFPSKLLEYLVSGVPILTTRLAGVPDEYYDFMSVIEDASSSGISEALRAFFAADQQFLLDKAACGRIWVSQTKSSSAVGRKILDFMERCN